MKNKGIIIVIISTILIILSSLMLSSEVTFDETTIIVVGNETYSFNQTMNFSKTRISRTWVGFNDTSWNVSSSNDINITLVFLHDDILNAPNETTVLEFKANTSSGNVWFNITGFLGNKIYNISKNSVYYMNTTSSYGGLLCFNNSVWSEIDFSVSPSSLVSPVNASNLTVITLNATQVTKNSAVFHGSLLNDSGYDCNCWFEYGTTTSYGTKTSNQTKNSGETFQYITGEVLSTGQLYHYRAVAEAYENITLTCSNDCYTSYDNPNTNYPADNGWLYIMYSIAHDETGYSFINFTGLNDYIGEKIKNARLGIAVNSNHGASRITIAPTIEYWNEQTVTYNTQPSLGSILIDSQQITISGAYQYFDVTDYINNCLNGSVNFSGFTIYDDDYAGESPSVGYSLTYRGKNYSSLKPILLLDIIYDRDNGSDMPFLTRPPIPILATASVVNVIDLNVSWTTGASANSTYVERRSTSGYWNRGNETFVYNDSKHYYLDDSVGENPLAMDTTYYYELWNYANWSYNGTLYQKYSSDLWGVPVSGTTYHVEPPYNGSSFYKYPNLNITWTKSNNSDYEIVVCRNDTYASIWNQSGNWLRQNSTNNYFNHSEDVFRYYSVFSYNATDQVYSYHGLNISYYGYVEINVFNESNPSQAVNNWNIHIKNKDGSQTYTSYNNNNPLYINVSDVPNGNNIILKVWATGYKERILTKNLLINHFYDFKFYLPPIETEGDGTGEPTLRTYTNSKSILNPNVDAIINLSYALEDLISVQIYNDTLYGSYGGWIDVSEDFFSFTSSQVTINESIIDENTSMARASYYYWFYPGEEIPTPIYYIRVVETFETSSGIFERPVSNVLVVFERYVNTTGYYEEMASLLTDANGYVNLYLIPSKLYQVTVNKTGYYENVSDYQPAPPNDFGQTIEKVFKIIKIGEGNVVIPKIKLDTMVLTPFNLTTVKVYYLNLNDDNSYVNFSIYDMVGDVLLVTYNVSSNPDDITFYFNYSSYNLSGDIITVVARAVRTNGSVYITIKYYNVNQGRSFLSAGYAPIVAIFSVGICLFGLTIAHPKRTFGFVGIVTMIVAVAITAFVNQTWYLHLLQAIELTLLLVIFLIFREEGVHAV